MMNPRKVCVSICFMIAALAVSLSAFADDLTKKDFAMGGAITTTAGAVAWGGGDALKNFSKQALGNLNRNPRTVKRLQRQVVAGRVTSGAGVAGIFIGIGSFGAGNIFASEPSPGVSDASAKSGLFIGGAHEDLKTARSDGLSSL